jgi:RNA polymerase sigma-70 factor (ECF subfamily)
MTGSPSLAEDLTQEVFLRVVRGLEAYEDLSREISWVFRIARNVLVDRHRSDARLPERASMGDAGSVARPALQPLTAALDEALGRLPAAEREAFLMREVGGLGYQEIAEATGSTPDGVRMRIYRARIALREALGSSRPAAAARTPKEVSK